MVTEAECAHSCTLPRWTGTHGGQHRGSGAAGEVCSARGMVQRCPHRPEQFSLLPPTGSWGRHLGKQADSSSKVQYVLPCSPAAPFEMFSQRNKCLCPHGRLSPNVLLALFRMAKTGNSPNAHPARTVSRTAARPRSGLRNAKSYQHTQQPGRVSEASGP